MSKLASILIDPRLATRAVLRRWPRATFEQRLQWDAIDRVHYGYGVMQAAQQARALGIERISVVEVGVAGGNGLVTLENIADEVSDATGVGIDVYGFDAGSGMPTPLDHRDLPYVWQPGFFEMDEPALRGRLRTASLVIGDVADTVPEFSRRRDLAPLGFVAFDVDYYSSTVAALGILDADADLRLPRLFCYFDDIIGDDTEIHCEYVGALLAIDEFNLGHRTRKVAPIHGLRHKRRLPASWNDQIYVCHDFDHPLYNQHIHPSEWDLTLVR